MKCTVLYCIVLYCIVLYCIVSYRIVSYRIVLYCIVLCCISYFPECVAKGSCSRMRSEVFSFLSGGLGACSFRLLKWDRSRTFTRVHACDMPDALVAVPWGLVRGVSFWVCLVSLCREDLSGARCLGGV